MKSILKSVVSSTLLAAGILGAGVASAHDHDGWHGRGHDYDGWHDHRYDYDNRARFVRPPVEEFTYASVVDVDPIVRQVAVSAPQQECWYEDREVYPRRGIDRQSTTPTIIGAIIGGVVGHQFDSGHSRNVGTVAGAMLGASVGHDSAVRGGGTEVRSTQRCAVRDNTQYEQQIDGYRVTYVYCGRQYTTVMSYDPGQRVRLRVSAGVAVVL